MFKRLWYQSELLLLQPSGHRKCVHCSRLPQQHDGHQTAGEMLQINSEQQQPITWWWPMMPQGPDNESHISCVFIRGGHQSFNQFIIYYLLYNYFSSSYLTISSPYWFFHPNRRNHINIMSNHTSLDCFIPIGIMIPIIRTSSFHVLCWY